MKGFLHRSQQTVLGSVFVAALALGTAFAQSPLQTAIGDQNVASFWTYDDLDHGMQQARTTGKPLLVTIRCVPCHACRGMDQQVVNPTDPELVTLMQQFVCVRIVQAWGLDLARFQYDMNQSWAAFFINADGVIYGRYGTRAAQRNDKAITVEGFSKALDGALNLHRQYLTEPDRTRAVLAAKTGPKPHWQKPDDIPVIQKTVRWGKPLGRMTGKEQAECLHCHFVPAANMMSMLDRGEPITDKTLWAYPLPETVGWTLDPEERASVTKVAKGSRAERAGFLSGDAIIRMNEQPILSIADVQWVLHQANETDTINIDVQRQGQPKKLALTLEKGWRRQDEFVSRISSWDFFKVKLFGVNQLDTLPIDDRNSLKLSPQQTALRVVKLTPNWGDMNSDARKAGLQEGDIIVSVDGRSTIQSHSDLLAYLVQEKQSGDTLALEVIRDKQRQPVNVPLQWTTRLNALRKP